MVANTSTNKSEVNKTQGIVATDPIKRHTVVITAVQNRNRFVPNFAVTRPRYLVLTKDIKLVRKKKIPSANVDTPCSVSSG